MKWWRDADVEARRALAAGMFGWMLDAFDVMLYALLLTSIIADLGISRQTLRTKLKDYRIESAGQGG